MKKGIQISILISILFLVVYYGIIRKGFSYFTGFGTPYSYFEAEKATHDSVLILYEQELTHPFFNVNTDKIQFSITRNTPYRLELPDPLINIQRRQLRYLVKVYYK